ncbi:MAG: glycosyltransferase [Solirubrobacterales bacterium]|nr:glycosyltransferase [Solirubrobacterales bacterium]
MSSASAVPRTIAPHDVVMPPRSNERFREVLAPDRMEALERATEQARALLDGRVVWNVNSTAKGGGVVELLRPLVAYARGAGVDARWVVIDGTPEFFTITKRIHNHLHGTQGDGGALDDEARRVYESVLAANLAAFPGEIRPGDVVILHDPQPAGMAAAMKAAGAAVIWRCHVGVDEPNAVVRATWEFLRPYVAPADLYVFSRAAFAWDGLDRERVVVIPPSIDAFSPKNVDLDDDTVRATLAIAGLVAGSAEPGSVTFERADGTPGRVERRARLVEDAPLPPDAAVVVQVSRWDALKDPIGVVRGFAEHVPADTCAHLVYAGPDVEAVADDPEGLRMLRETVAAREALPEEARARVHLASLPMEDLDENAIMVNALQRHARVITQKSLAEGFGLTVAEAMWKARPVIAPRIGGIQEQIVDGDSGVLLDDPRDLAAFGAAMTGLLDDAPRAERIGRNARERVRARFLNARTLLDYFEAIRRLLDDRERSVPTTPARRRAPAAKSGAAG